MEKDNMANIKPPTQTKRKSTKGAPPPESKASTNLNKQSSGSIAYFSFRTPPEFKKRFQIRAIEENIKDGELFIKAFDFYMENKD